MCSSSELIRIGKNWVSAVGAWQRTLVLAMQDYQKREIQIAHTATLCCAVINGINGYLHDEALWRKVPIWTNPFEKVSNFDHSRYRKCHLWAKIEASSFFVWKLVRYVVLILQVCNRLTRCNGPGSELAPLLSGCVSRSDLTQSFARGPGGTEISRRSASVPTRCHPQPDWEINDEPHETVLSSNRMTCLASKILTGSPVWVQNFAWMESAGSLVSLNRSIFSLCLRKHFSRPLMHLMHVWDNSKACN